MDTATMGYVNIQTVQAQSEYALPESHYGAHYQMTLNPNNLPNKKIQWTRKVSANDRSAQTENAG